MDTRNRDCTITLHKRRVLTEQPNSQTVGYTEAIPTLGPLTSHAAYAAGRISSNLKQAQNNSDGCSATATKVSSLSITSANPASIRICLAVDIRERRV
jgi:hypothetical protein